MRGQTDHIPLSRRLAVTGGALVAAVSVAVAPAHAQAQSDTTKKDSAATPPRYPLMKAVRDSNGAVVLQLKNTELKDGMVVKLNGQKFDIIMPEQGKSNSQTGTDSTKADATKAAADSTKAKHSSH